MAAPETPESIILLGAGGHAWVVAEAARAAGLRIGAAYDDNPQAASPGDAATIAGPLEAFIAPAADSSPGARPPAGPGPWIIAIGDIARRRELITRLESLDGLARAVVHPRAVVSPTATVGRGAFISAGVIVNARAQIAGHTIINTGAIIEHDCRIACGAHVAPGAVLGGEVVVGEDAFIGLGARIRPGVQIGAGATIAMGAVVVGDVPPGVTVRGVPARID